MLRRLLFAAALVVVTVRSAPAQDAPCAELRVSQRTPGDQGRPRVASTPDGGYLVVWTAPGPLGVYGRAYDAAGSPRGPEFRISTNTNRSHHNPAVAVDAAGNAVVVWDSDGIRADVFGQRLDPAGNLRGPEFRVNTDTDYEQERAASVPTPPGTSWSSG